MLINWNVMALFHSCLHWTGSPYICYFWLWGVLLAFQIFCDVLCNVSYFLYVIGHDVFSFHCSYVSHKFMSFMFHKNMWKNFARNHQTCTHCNHSQTQFKIIFAFNTCTKFERFKWLPITAFIPSRNLTIPKVRKINCKLFQHKANIKLGIFSL